LGGDLGGFQAATLAGYKADHNRSLELSNIWIYGERPAGRSPSVAGRQFIADVKISVCGALAPIKRTNSPDFARVYYRHSAQLVVASLAGVGSNFLYATRVAALLASCWTNSYVLLLIKCHMKKARAITTKK